MSGRKNVLPAFLLIDDESLTADFISDATNIQYLDNVGIQLHWTAGGAGRFLIEVSMNHRETDPNGYSVEGNFDALDLNSSIVVTDAEGGIYIDLNELAAPWVRLSYVNEFHENGSITTRADVAGNLNNKYFLIDGSDGDNWYIWFNVDSGGTDPMLPGRTGIEVAITAGDSAGDVAGLLAMALINECTSIEDVTQPGGAGTSDITFNQTTTASGDLTDGPGGSATAFTLDYNIASGTVNAYIGAKQI